MTKRTVIARHRTTGEQRKGTLDDEQSILTDEHGNYLDHWWEYYDLSPHFTAFAIIVALGTIWAIWYIFSGAAS
jgi:hypothetical protein